MAFSGRLWFLFLFIAYPAIAQNALCDVLQYVDKLIGSINGVFERPLSFALSLKMMGKSGNVFLGATIPYGKPWLQLWGKAHLILQAWQKQWPTQIHEAIKVVSHGILQHAWFRGWRIFVSRKLCSFPICKPCLSQQGRKVSYVIGSLKASPGYFGMESARGIQINMTTSQHIALFRFNFYAGTSKSLLVLMDLTDLSDSC